MLIFIDAVLFPFSLILSLFKLREGSNDSIFGVKRPETDKKSDLFDNLLGLRIWHSPRTQKLRIPRRVLSIHGLSGKGLDVTLHLPGFGLSDRAHLSTSQYGFFLHHVILKFKPQVIIVYGWSVVPVLMALGNASQQLGNIQLVVIDPLITHEFISTRNILYLGRLSFLSSFVLLFSKFLDLFVILKRKWISFVEFLKIASGLKLSNRIDISGFKIIMAISSITSYFWSYISNKWENANQKAYILSEYSPVIPWIRFISRPTSTQSQLTEASPNISVVPEVASYAKNDGNVQQLDVGKNTDFFTLRSMNSSYTTSWDDMLAMLKPAFYQKQIDVSLYFTEYAHEQQNEYFKRLFDKDGYIVPYGKLHDHVETMLNKV